MLGFRYPSSKSHIIVLTALYYNNYFHLAAEYEDSLSLTAIGQVPTCSKGPILNLEETGGPKF